jgi:YVTN family beta-propeller protein
MSVCRLCGRAVRAVLCCVVLAGGLASVVSASASKGPVSIGGAVCSSGSDAAVVGGRHVCLRVGLKCKAQFQAAYRRHGFVCRDGRLRKLAKPKPLITKLALPAAQPLPSGTATLTLPTSDWVDGVDLALTESAVWTAGGLWRIDPATNVASGPLASSAQSNNVGTGEGSVWASEPDSDLVRRYDPVTGQLQAVIQLPAGSLPEGITDADGAIWVADHHQGTISRIDPATNTVVASVKVGPAGASGPQGIATGLGSVWVTVGNIDSVVRVNPATNTVQARIPMPGQAMSPCGGIAVGQTAVWVTSCLDGTLVARIDPARNTVASILDVGGKVIQPAADGNTVWFVAGGDPALAPAPASVLHLDAGDRVLTRYALPEGFISAGAAAAFGSIWLSDFNKPLVLRIPNTG